jgi:DNA N-6-adenine-methyltransferase Dam
MTALTREQEHRPAVTRASKAASEIHAFDKAEEIAKRVKDASALEGALIGKLESQRDFAAQYRDLFPPKTHAPERAHDERTVWCQSFGFALRTVQRWLDLLDPALYVEKKNAILKRCWELAELWQAANFSSALNEWYTPARYIEAVREVLGGIDLDPASSEQANAVVKASEFFSIEEDGLKRDWFGRVFTNPPYGKTDDGNSLAAAFCNKAIMQFIVGNIEAGIVLVNSLHSQSWQAPLYNYPICFVDHRIQFVSADGEQNKNPTFQNIFVYLGRDLPMFAKIFTRFGYVMQRAST